MGASVQGADLEALDLLARDIQRHAGTLQAVTNQATSGVTALDRLWDGPDSAQFKQQWLRTHRPKMNLAMQELRDAAATIERNRRAQELTSAADGGGTGAGGATFPSPFTDGFFPPGASPPSGAGPPDRSLAGDVADFLFGDVANFWGGGADGLPIGSLGAALLKMNRIRAYGWANGPFPVFNTGFVGTRLASVLEAGPGVLGRAGNWLGSPGATSAFRGIGIAGGVVSTGLGAYDLYQQGNPIDAFQANGAGYVADVAGTAFSASTTAFLIAPNPVTAGLAIGTGLVWAGAEVVDNWDDIAEWTSDAWVAGTDFVGDLGSGALDLAADVGGAATGFVGDVGGGIGQLAGGAVSAIGDWF